MPKLTSINQLDQPLVKSIEDRINVKLDQMPEELIPRLLDELGDPPNPENITSGFVTLITMTIQDQVRRVVDKRFENHLKRLFDKYPREIQAHLKTAPYIGGPPASWWNEKQQELENSLAVFLIAAYGLSAKWHGMDQRVAEIQSAKYAASQAKSVAAGFIENSRNAMEKMQANWAAAAATVGGLSMMADNLKASPPATKTAGPPASTKPPSFSDVRHALKEVFSPARIERMAVSEVTDAITHAGEATKQQAGLSSEEDTWWTEDDDRVCPICEPLHGQPRSVWAEKFPLGPKAHYKCRCRIAYAS
ncbi:Phage Mu protein F like protein [Gimesia alba]|uniref:Phage Mu protein F like protein n=1 Tax=Gimesia alba TaxID=2527973 RepID=A0A517RB58_9PLAN|nr:phage minor head protein [Gimesia alba]QDT41074.1 Phage Mu protein F like protein [Gimesia alba]